MFWRPQTGFSVVVASSQHYRCAGATIGEDSNRLRLHSNPLGKMGEGVPRHRFSVTRRLTPRPTCSSVRRRRRSRQTPYPFHMKNIMSSVNRGSLAVLTLALALASDAVAQARPAAPRQTATRQAAPPDQGFWELGQDMSVALGIDDPKTFIIRIPTLAVRAGYYVTPVLTLEPQLMFVSVAQENQTGFSTWALQLGGLYHLSADRRQNQIFIHPGITFTGGSGGSGPITLSAGVGMKRPMLAGRLAMRGEVNLNHTLEDGGTPASTGLAFILGWSVYTK